MAQMVFVRWLHREENVDQSSDTAPDANTRKSHANINA